jgi:hypothetical protein
MGAALMYWTAGRDGRIPEHAGKTAEKWPADGPGGSNGTLASPEMDCGDILYEPAHQTWTAYPGRPGLWVGVDARVTVRPAGLARPAIIDGHRVEMAGAEWVIPVARMLSGGCGLPRRRVLTAEGGKSWKVDDAYQSLCRFAERAWTAMNGGANDITEDELDAACGAALAVNYRIGEIEAIALGMMTAEAQRKIVQALVDYPTAMRMIEAAEKKDRTPA